MECPWEKKQLQIEQSWKGRHTFSICRAWGKNTGEGLPVICLIFDQ